MSGRIKDGNPNIVDLSDQNRPTEMGDQFSELYDNQWTHAYGAIDDFFGSTKAESDIIQILLEILEVTLPYNCFYVWQNFLILFYDGHDTVCQIWHKHKAE